MGHGEAALRCQQVADLSHARPLSPADVIAAYTTAAEQVADALGIDSSVAERLLTHPKVGWNCQYLCEWWASGRHELARALGVPVALSDGSSTDLARCHMCDERPADGVGLSACGAHWGCLSCWQGYLSAQAELGNVLKAACPLQCGAMLTRALWRAVLLPRELHGRTPPEAAAARARGTFAPEPINLQRPYGELRGEPLNRAGAVARQGFRSAGSPGEEAAAALRTQTRVLTAAERQLLRADELRMHWFCEAPGTRCSVLAGDQCVDCAALQRVLKLNE